MTDKNETNHQPQLGSGKNPPNRRQIADYLKENAARWDAIRETAPDFGATWKWAYSDKTEKWSCRAYLPGDRFFASLTLTDNGFEVSLNLKQDEWATIVPTSPRQEPKIADLREKALASGEDPAWVHVSVASDDDLALVVALLVARARRVQKPRLKPAKKR
jgi:hypothetical protein